MRKNLLSALVAGAFAFGAGGAQAALSFDLNGTSNPGGLISVLSFDWAPTSFAAIGGNTAIANFIGGKSGKDIEFDVLTHAKLSAYVDGAGNTKSLPAGFGEITMVGRFTEKVTGFDGSDPTSPAAKFQTTGAGWVQMFYSGTGPLGSDSHNLTGANFNNGRLIMTADGVKRGVGPGQANGSFTVDGGAGTVILDGAGANDYGATQKTVQGEGNQNSISFGTTGIDLDSTFFLTAVSDFSILFTNISIGLPYTSVDPSDCFNPSKQPGAAGTTGLASTCADTHVANSAMSAQGMDGGIRPVIGAINGINTSGPDFIAQTDYNSPLTGSAPEPGMLALLGLAFGAMGFASKRRRQA